MRKRFSELHPAIYHTRIFQKRLFRKMADRSARVRFASEPLHSYHVFERNHRFTSIDETNYRENEIWREVIDRRSGNKLREELLVRNFSEVKYELNFPAQQCSF